MDVRDTKRSAIQKTNAKQNRTRYKKVRDTKIERYSKKVRQKKKYAIQKSTRYKKVRFTKN